MEKYTKSWLISYKYGGFGTSVIDGDTFEEALEALKEKISHSLVYVRHELFAEFTRRGK